MKRETRPTSILSEQDIFDIRRPAPDTNELQRNILIQSRGLAQQQPKSSERVGSSAGRALQSLFGALWPQSQVAVTASLVCGLTLVGLLSWVMLPTFQQASQLDIVDSPYAELDSLALAELDFQDSILLNDEFLFEEL